MVNRKIDTHGIQFSPKLEDVETLNQWAANSILDITKLSYNTFLQQSSHYALLHSGSALGKGVGPLLICRPGEESQDINAARIAIPGKNTTANLLLSLAHPQAKNKTERLFSEIEAAVLNGEFDAGLVIHESRFTYADRGLARIMDLGDWWESHAGAAIPLGGIAIRRNIDPELGKTVDGIIRESVAYSWKHYPELSPYVKEHAQEMNPDVMRKHIDLYVNEYTTDLGPIGEKAIQVLFEKASAAGLIQSKSLKELFY